MHFNHGGQLTSLPPLTLYVHIPWCVQKCPYCDFNSHQAPSDLGETAYIQALLTDLAQELPHVWGRPVHSVFIGGGTPSLFSAQAIDALLSGIRAHVRLLPEAEITLEANPGTFERARFEDYARSGINRLSIGVQSFDNAKLSALGRIHNDQEALAAIELALATFDQVNIDLMYALPGQTVVDALADVHTALATGVQHISAYHLTMEPNTPFGHTPPPSLPSEEGAHDIEDAVHSALAQAGFQRYETSAFTQNGQPCRHNLNYWQFGDYIGIGAGAHGKISSASAIERTVRSRHPKDYLGAMQQEPSLAISRVPVATHDLPFEFMLNALRLSEGVPAAWFSERTGLSLSHITKALQKATELGLLCDDVHKLQATAKGQRFLNNLLQLFLQD